MAKIWKRTAALGAILALAACAEERSSTPAASSAPATAAPATAAPAQAGIRPLTAEALNAAPRHEAMKRCAALLWATLEVAKTGLLPPQGSGDLTAVAYGGSAFQTTTIDRLDKTSAEITRATGAPSDAAGAQIEAVKKQYRQNLVEHSKATGNPVAGNALVRNDWPLCLPVMGL